MLGARIVIVMLGVFAVAGCAANHSDDPRDAAPGGDTAGGPAADSCQLNTTAPRTFPEDGPCDDSEPTRGGVPDSKASGHYTVTCDPQPLEAPGCNGVPNDAWNKCALRRCESKISYPKGCYVTMPTRNPHWNAADTCMCDDTLANGNFQWTCPI
jgi:hypothetical protein